MSHTVYALPRLVPDPMPYVSGKGLRPAGLVPRMLTKREYAALLPVLEAAEGERGHRYDPSNDDEWTAFGSLLWGGYLQEGMPNQFVLTRKGQTYLDQIRE